MLLPDNDPVPDPEQNFLRSDFEPRRLPERRRCADGREGRGRENGRFLRFLDFLRLLDCLDWRCCLGRRRWRDNDGWNRTSLPIRRRSQRRPFDDHRDDFRQGNLGHRRGRRSWQSLVWNLTSSFGWRKALERRLRQGSRLLQLTFHRPQHRKQQLGTLALSMGRLECYDQQRDGQNEKDRRHQPKYSEAK